MTKVQATTIVLDIDFENKTAIVVGTDIYFDSEEWFFLMKSSDYFTLLYKDKVMRVSRYPKGVYIYCKGDKKYLSSNIETLTIERLIKVVEELAA